METFKSTNDSFNITEEDLSAIENFYTKYPQLKNGNIHNILRPKEKFKFSLPDFNEEDQQLNVLKQTNENHAWIQTYTGKKFYPLDPKEEHIDIIDIGHALSNICRFTGHSNFFYSVAQHSVLVSYLCDREYALQGLLHDASEYALTDISSPIKKLPIFEEYRKAEKHLQKMIFRKFGIPEEEHSSVKEADLRLLYTEAQEFLSSTHPEWVSKCDPYPFRIDPLPPKEAERLFLDRFDDLYEQALIK